MAGYESSRSPNLFQRIGGYFSAGARGAGSGISNYATSIGDRWSGGNTMNRLGQVMDLSSPGFTAARELGQGAMQGIRGESQRNAEMAHDLDVLRSDPGYSGNYSSGGSGYGGGSPASGYLGYAGGDNSYGDANFVGPGPNENTAGYGGGSSQGSRPGKNFAGITMSDIENMLSAGMHDRSSRMTPRREMSSDRAAMRQAGFEKMAGETPQQYRERAMQAGII